MKNYKTWKILLPLVLSLPAAAKSSRALQNKLLEVTRTGTTVQLEQLIQKGAYVKRTKERKPPYDSALHIAVKRGDKAMTATLLSFGAKLEAKNQNKRTPLYYAVKEKKYKLLKMLLKQGASAASLPSSDSAQTESPFILAVKEGNYEAVRLMTKYAEDLPQQTLDEGLFHLPSKSKKGKELLELLLRSGANLEAKNVRGETVLGSYCFSLISPNYIPELLEKKAKTETRDKAGNTPLAKTVLHSKREKFRDLVEGKASLTTRNFKEQNILHLAAQNNFGGTLAFVVEALEGKKLLEKLISQKDIYGNTPLHYAVKSAHFEEVDFLLEKGARARAHNLLLKKPWDLLHKVYKEKKDFPHAEVIEKLRLASRNIFQKIKEEEEEKAEPSPSSVPDTNAF